MSLPQYAGPEYSIWSLLNNPNLSEEQQDYLSVKHFDALRAQEQHARRIAELEFLQSTGEVVVIGYPSDAAARVVTMPTA